LLGRAATPTTVVYWTDAMGEQAEAPSDYVVVG
jgi:hypothetical protein